MDREVKVEVSREGLRSCSYCYVILDDTHPSGYKAEECPGCRSKLVWPEPPSLV